MLSASTFSSSILLFPRAARWFSAVVALVLAVFGSAQAQCTTGCTITAASGTNYNATNLPAYSVLCITSNYSGSIVVATSNVTICNSANFSGSLTVNSNVTGTVINNVGNVSSSSISLNSSTTINNGSSNGGATVVSAAVWSGNFYSGNPALISVPITINNYASWTGSQIDTFSGGTITNYANATWSTYIYHVRGATAIINNGTWGTYQVNDIVGDFTLTNTTTWSSPITPNGGANQTTIVNSGTWGSAGQISSNSTLRVTNSGTWANALFSNTGSTTITNSGAWNNTAVSYIGALSITHSGTSWNAIPQTNAASSSSLTVSNSATWTIGIDFPNGPNTFNALSGGTTTFSQTPNLSFAGPTTFQNSGTLTISKNNSGTPQNLTVLNNSGATANLNGGFINVGAITNNGNLVMNAGLVNSGTINNNYLITVTGNFTNSGTITGPNAPSRGSITVTAVTTNNGVFGMTGYLDFCDGTPPTPASNGFDSRGGASNVGSNTTFCSARPLPVELTSFTAELAKSQVQVRWSTASEHNSAKFIVERSTNGELFAALQAVAAQGNATNATAYAATDAKPLAGTSYYRLRQIDLDGSATFSPIAAIRNEAAQQFGLYPNPATNHLTVDLSTALAAPCEVRITNLTGQLVLNKTVTGGNLQEFSLASLPVGVYLLQVRTGQGSTVQRIQKQ